MDSRADELARAEKELEDLKSRRPEHCHGAEGYVGVHQASPELLAEIEELEERIRELKVETE